MSGGKEKRLVRKLSFFKPLSLTSEKWTKHCVMGSRMEHQISLFHKVLEWKLILLRFCYIKYLEIENVRKNVLILTSKISKLTTKIFFSLPLFNKWLLWLTFLFNSCSFILLLNDGQNWNLDFFKRLNSVSSISDYAEVSEAEEFD